MSTDGVVLVLVDLYQSILRPVLFSGLRTDPEWLHQQTLQVFDWMERTAAVRSLMLPSLGRSYTYKSDRLSQSLWGLEFVNPLGLAAGFDKNGVGAGLWHEFGFGFAEMGTVTLHAQPGNPQPRLFRLMEDEAVLNRMGFNNQGAAQLQKRLQDLATRMPQRVIPIGVNLGKSKITPLEEAAEDYRGSFKLLKDLGDYFVVNVSSPNTPGLRSLQAIDQLEPIFTALKEENTAGKPILVKIAPDLADEDIREVVELSVRSNMAGIIATNTTIRRDGLKTQVIAKTGKPVTDEAGGISGKPVRDRSTEVIRLIYQQTEGELPIVGVGGIFTAQDAWEKITAGASLVQVYTGWIYEGPGMAKRVMQGLVERLDQAGMQQIGEAVGTAAK